MSGDGRRQVAQRQHKPRVRWYHLHVSRRVILLLMQATGLLPKILY